MISNCEHTAASCREAFLSWVRRAALPLPASPEEPLGERAQADAIYFVEDVKAE